MVCHLYRLMQAAFNDQRYTATPAQRMRIQSVFRHAVFCPAIQASDNHLIKRRMTMAAYGLLLKLAFGDAIFRSTVEATNDEIVRVHEKA